MFGIFNRKIKGSLTIEATLILPLVIVTLLFIANILNICMVHVCMQQALNNTAKKISQDSYFVYRFAGEKNYNDFIKKLGSFNTGYDKFEKSATLTKDSFDKLEKAVNGTLKSFEKATNTFKDVDIISGMRAFPKNINEMMDSYDGTWNEFNSFITKINELKNDGVENFQSIVTKLLVDTGTGFVTSSISEYIFNKYTNELKVPASRIKDIIYLNSSLNDDGSITMFVNYLYINPFSFINTSSAEYKIINKTIRMSNIITIKPFVGKNNTSFIISNNENNNENENQIENKIIYIYITKSGKRYHSKEICNNSHNTGIVTLEQAKELGMTPCGICLRGIEPTEPIKGIEP